MTSNQSRSFGSRLWWLIRTTLLIFIFVALVAAVVGGLGYAGYLGVQEIQRSNNSLTMRIDANEQNLNSLRDLVNSEFAQGNPEQQVQINQLENELAALTSQLDELKANFEADTAVQAEQIQTLGAGLETAVAQNSDLARDLDTVQAALVALQSDLNSSVVRLDEVGGDVDRLRLQLGSLDDALTEFTAEAAAARDAIDVPQSITLLQLWGVLTNARLALVDEDVDGAETAVAQAIALSANFVVEPDSAAAAALDRLQTRLTLAADGFATNLPLVAQDLAAASRDLNLLLSGPTAEPDVVETTPTPTETVPGTAVPATATPTPAPTATP